MPIKDWWYEGGICQDVGGLRKIRGPNIIVPQLVGFSSRDTP